MLGPELACVLYKKSQLISRDSSLQGNVTDNQVLTTVEAICITWFTIEYILRHINNNVYCTLMESPLINRKLKETVTQGFIYLALSSVHLSYSSWNGIFAVTLTLLQLYFRIQKEILNTMLETLKTSLS
jgi:hypothetical protein